MKRSRLLVAVLAALIVVVALALPALAGAATPSFGWFSGHDADRSVKFHVHRSPSGTPYVDRAEFAPDDRDEFRRQADFEVAPVHSGGRFGTCAYERVNDVFSREYCMYGEFDAPDRASGKVVISISAGGQRWPKPLGVYTWKAEQLPR